MAYEKEKTHAAKAALDFVEDGMVLGLGTGSTATVFVELLAEEVADGLLVRGVPTSEATRRCAEAHGIPLLPIEQVDTIHLAVDGTDEVDHAGNLIKGGGGALLREKIIASTAGHLVIIADPSKQAKTLGAFPLPVEVIPFGYTLTAKRVFEALRECGIAAPRVNLRKDAGGDAYLTDNGNHILDCSCGEITDPALVADKLSSIVGVAEHGLFVKMARTVIIGNEQGNKVFEF